MDSTPKNSGHGSSQTIAKNGLWQRGRWALTVTAIVLVAAWFRGIWWPIPFHSYARQALSQRKNDVALVWLDWATYLASEDGETAFLRARAYRRIGDFQQSMDAIKRARSMQPKSQRFQREEWLCQAHSGQLNKVSVHVPELLKDPRGEFEEISEALVVGCVLKQRYSEANDLLQTWIADRPNHARPLLLRAKLRQMKLQSAEAIDDLRHAHSIEPDNAEVAFELASSLQERNELNEARPLFNQVLNVPQFAGPAHVGLAICLRSQGDTVRIGQLLERALTLAPGNAVAVCESGRHQMEIGNASAAVARLKEAVRIAPRDDECCRVLAMALTADHKPFEARQQFEFSDKIRDGKRELTRLEGVLSKNPADVEAMVGAGSLMLDVADESEGVSRLLAALEIDPKHRVARKRLADYFTIKAKANPALNQYVERYRDPPDSR